MSSRTKRIVTVIIIIVCSIILGIVVDLVWGAIEKKTHPDDFSMYITQYSVEYNVPETVIYAVIKVESDFDPRARSSAGARGLMQMMPKTFEWLTGEEHLGENLDTEELYEPEVSIKYGTYYLNYLHKKFNNNWNTALAAYNGGEGNVTKWLKDAEYSDDGITLKDIPFDETKDYVKKVNREIDTYKRLYYEQNEVRK
ncbi:MAG: lytic transglycosylase domain-containing protein [Ruminococcaceae bacterium]|nr:lytic transglycosylase domain-containing protein [Oscillospiraceae bacterium]